MPHGAHVKIDTSGFKMKQAKQRVIAIDYFRGVFILMVVMNHAALFSLPFAYFTGNGALWTSAAEMFCILSGLTFGIVRGHQLKIEFKRILLRTWRRAAIIYSINIAMVVLSLLLSLWLSGHGLKNDVPGSLPNNSGISLLFNILTFKYSLGWSSFLMYYSVFLIFAPFAYYVLRTRLWALLPGISIAAFALHTTRLSFISNYDSFLMWQLYFVMGMVAARFRVPILSTIYDIRHKSLLRLMTYFTFASAATLFFINLALSYSNNLAPIVGKLANEGWLPVKLQAAYIKLINHREIFDTMFMEARNALLRPIVAIILLMTIYIIYQNNKDKILRISGKIMLTFGKETLWIFAAQAIAIPLVAILPVQNSLAGNTALTAILIYIMWIVADRRRKWAAIIEYIENLKLSYSQAKNTYLQGYEEDI
jgi:hypothetical protein